MQSAQQSGLQAANGIKGAVNSAAKSVSETTNDLSAQVTDKATDLGQRFGRMKDQVLSTVSEEMDVVTELTQKAAKQFPKVIDSIERNIRKHPFTAAAVALGVGALAVNLLTRDRSRDLH